MTAIKKRRRASCFQTALMAHSPYNCLAMFNGMEITKIQTGKIYCNCYAWGWGEDHIQKYLINKKYGKN